MTGIPRLPPGTDLARMGLRSGRSFAPGVGTNGVGPGTRARIPRIRAGVDLARMGLGPANNSLAGLSPAARRYAVHSSPNGAGETTGQCGCSQPREGSALPMRLPGSARAYELALRSSAGNGAAAATIPAPAPHSGVAAMSAAQSVQTRLSRAGLTGLTAPDSRLRVGLALPDDTLTVSGFPPRIVPIRPAAGDTENICAKQLSTTTAGGNYWDPKKNPDGTNSPEPGCATCQSPHVCFGKSCYCSQCATARACEEKYGTGWKCCRNKPEDTLTCMIPGLHSDCPPDPSPMPPPLRRPRPGEEVVAPTPPATPPCGGLNYGPCPAGLECVNLAEPGDPVFIWGCDNPHKCWPKYECQKWTDECSLYCAGDGACQMCCKAWLKECLKCRNDGPPKCRKRQSASASTRWEELTVG